MESMDRAREIAKDVPATSPDGVVPPTRPWTVVLLLDDGDQRQMFMEAVLAPDPVAAVEVARDLAQTPDSGWENATVTDIITIPGEHDAVGPSEPWW